MIGIYQKSGSSLSSETSAPLEGRYPLEVMFKEPISCHRYAFEEMLKMFCKVLTGNAPEFMTVAVTLNRSGAASRSHDEQRGINPPPPPASPGPPLKL